MLDAGSLRHDPSLVRAIGVLCWGFDKKPARGCGRLKLLTWQPDELRSPCHPCCHPVALPASLPPLRRWGQADGCGVLQRVPHDRGGIEDPGFQALGGGWWNRKKIRKAATIALPNFPNRRIRYKLAPSARYKSS